MNKYMKAVRKSKPIRLNVRRIHNKMRDLGLKPSHYEASDIVDAAMEMFEKEKGQ